MDLVDVPGEVVLPSCRICNMQPNFVTAPNPNPNNDHEQSQACERMGTKFQQHVNTEVATRALEETSTAYGVDLERVQVFKYLGMNSAYADSDAQAIRKKFERS